MKILRYEKNGKTGYGALQDDDSISELLGSPFDDYQVGGKVAELGEVNVLAPVQPSKIIGVGLNYILHIEESGAATPSFPMLFMKPPTGVIGQGDTIQVPNTDHRVEYEVELAVVMGKRTKNVSEEEALDYVLGYTCGNDVSDRDIQLAEMKMGAMAVGKGFDTYCPLGPAIATDLDPTNVDVKTRLNGEEKQNANTSDMLFSAAYLISYISSAMTLLPGDVIMTGTPSGVGPMADGDVVEIELSGVGTLRNPISRSDP